MRYAPVSLYAAVLLVSAIPGDDLGTLPTAVATGGHALAYALLALLLRLGGRDGAAVVAWCLLGAVVNEVEQLLVPGRAGDVTDVAVDLLGALAGLLAAAALRRQRRAFEASGSSAV